MIITLNRTKISVLPRLIKMPRILNRAMVAKNLATALPQNLEKSKTLKLESSSNSVTEPKIRKEFIETWIFRNLDKYENNSIYY